MIQQDVLSGFFFFFHQSRSGASNIGIFFLFLLVSFRQDGLHDSGSRPGGHRGGGASSVPA